MKYSLTSLLLVCLVFTTGLLSAQTGPQTATNVPVFPKYQVLGVVYAPPGASSSVTYGNSTAVGSTQSISTGSSNMQVMTKESSVGGGLFGFSQTKNTASSTGWTTQTSSTGTIAVQTALGNAISTAGPISSSLGVNHDNDVIYILLNPVLVNTVTYDPSTHNISSIFLNNIENNGCDLSSPANSVSFYQRLNGCDANQYPFPDIVGIPVWCLKNPYYPGQGCSQWQAYTSRSWDQSYWGPINPTATSAYPSNSAGLTLGDFADILQADPFVSLNGNAINVCHPTHGPNLDPNDSETPTYNPQPIPPGSSVYDPAPTPSICGATGPRFQPYGSVQYPEPGPNGLPTTYTGTFSYTNTNTELIASSDTHTTSNSVSTTKGFSQSYGGGYIPVLQNLGFDLASFSASFTNGNSQTMTLQNSSSNETQAQKASTANYSITGPQLSDAYTGPATYNVYLDNIYGTYAFYSSLEPPITLGTIGISPSSLAFQTPTAVLNKSTTPIMVTLTNTSIYPMTMVSPAVSFSDPGFQITPDGSDRCSNQYLQPNQSCTLHVSFAPQLSDAQNPVTLINTVAGVPIVSAFMIAAGTENASTYQNVLVTGQIPVSGVLSSANPTTDGSSQGGLLIAENTSGISQTNPVPYVFVFPKAQTGSGAVQSFIFTNNYSADVTVQAINISNTTNFYTDATSSVSPCSPGTVLHYGAFCRFNVGFFADGDAVDQTAISIIGNTNLLRLTGILQPVPASAVFTLATAGAVGTSGAAMTISGSQPPEIYLASNNCSGYSNCGISTPIQINNQTGAPLSLGFSLTVTAPGFVPPDVDNSSGNSCGSENNVLPAGQSCTFMYIVPDIGPATTFVGSLTVTGITSSGFPMSIPVAFQEDIYPNDPAPCTNPIGCVSPEFKLAPSTTAQSSTIHQGDTAIFSFQVGPTGPSYPASVSFAVAGLPVGAVATFSQSTLAATAGSQVITLSVKTPAIKAQVTTPLVHSSVLPIALASLFLPLVFTRGRRRVGASLRLCVIVAFSSILCLGSFGCAGTSSSVAAATPAVLPQTYSIVVTATCGTTTQSLTFPLTIE